MQILMLDRAYQFWLVLLQKILGIKEKDMARNATIISISHGVALLRGIVTGYLVARMLPRETYGQYQFILAAFGSATVLSLPGIDVALRRAIAGGQRGIIARIFKAHALICLIGAAVLLGIISFLTPDQRHTFWPLFVLAAVLFPVSQTASTLFGALTVGDALFKTALKANIVLSTLVALSTLAVLFIYPSSTLLFLSITAIPAMIYLIFSKKLLPPPDPSLSTKPVLKYSIQLTMLALPLYFSTYVDKFLISSMFGVKQLAVFSIASLIPEHIKTWSKELLPVSFAIHARGENSWERRKRLLLIVGRLTLLSVIPIFFYILLAPLFFRILFPNYPDAVFLTQIASIFLITLPGAFLTQYLQAQAMLKSLQWTQWLSIILYLIALFTLLPAFGLVGAIIARGVLRIVTVLCGLYFCLWPPASDTTTPA